MLFSSFLGNDWTTIGVYCRTGSHGGIAIQKISAHPVNYPASRGPSLSRKIEGPLLAGYPRIYVVGCFVNFWVNFGYIWEEIVFLEGLVKLRETRNIED